MCIRQDRHGRAVVAMSSEKEGAAVVESTHWHASEVSRTKKQENKKKTPIHTSWITYIRFIIPLGRQTLYTYQIPVRDLI